MNYPTSSEETQGDPIQGADNLLQQCLCVQSGQSVLLVLEEDESLYKRDVGQLIEQRCRALGTQVTVLTEPLIQHVADFPQTVSDVMKTVDHTLFLSRLGDYVRFVELPGHCTKTTAYTFSKAHLATPYACVSNTLLAQLRDKLEQELLAAKTWQITCPLGSDLKGEFRWPSLQGEDDNEILVALFPVSTFNPVPCYTATGRVALSRWLMPGGAPKIESPGLTLSDTVFCEVADGMVQGFSGPGCEPEKVAKHYDRVSSTLGINRNRVHSWHLGINPQTFFPTDPDLDFERWCALSFGSPRYLHLHTCGDEPPGEIAWSLFNCSVLIDDQLYWEDGQFNWLKRADNRKIISNHTGAEILFEPSLTIGV